MINPEEFSVTVTGDTLMPNGKTYFILDNLGAARYQRVEENKFVYYYDRSDSSEYLLYDFEAPDKTIWVQNLFPEFYYGIDTTQYWYNYYFQKFVPVKTFDWVLIDSTATPPDTIFGALLDVWPTKITKGIGITNDGNDHGGLYAAIINGDTIGTITHVNDPKIAIDDYELYQNYPNPFNPTTKIRFVIPDVETLRATSLQTGLAIYNILGKKIATLVNEYKQPGTYEIEFNAANLSSGVYFYRLTAGNFSETKKMVLLR